MFEKCTILLGRIKQHRHYVRLTNSTRTESLLFRSHIANQHGKKKKKTQFPVVRDKTLRDPEKRSEMKITHIFSDTYF